jgi:hypothetical protein
MYSSRIVPKRQTRSVWHSRQAIFPSTSYIWTSLSAKRKTDQNSMLTMCNAQDRGHFSTQLNQCSIEKYISPNVIPDHIKPFPFAMQHSNDFWYDSHLYCWSELYCSFFLNWWSLNRLVNLQIWLGQRVFVYYRIRERRNENACLWSRNTKQVRCTHPGVLWWWGLWFTLHRRQQQKNRTFDKIRDVRQQIKSKCVAHAHGLGLQRGAAKSLPLLPCSNTISIQYHYANNPKTVPKQEGNASLMLWTCIQHEVDGVF